MSQLMPIFLVTLVICLCGTIVAPEKLLANDLEIFEWMTNTQLDHVIFSGTVVAQESRVISNGPPQHGVREPYSILEIQVAEILVGKRAQKVWSIVVPASFYVKDQEFLLVARFSDGTGLGIEEMDEPLVFFERDRVLISAEYIPHSVYDVDSTKAAWGANVVRFLKAGSDSLYRESVSFDDAKAQHIAEEGYEVNARDFVTREFKATGTTLSELKTALSNTAKSTKK